MAIPKKIHYCWFGGNSLPKLAKRCIKSWKRYCPDYEIIRWDETNFDIESAPLYVQQAYSAKKWAFVTDYVRLKVVYEYGGIYLDTDVELINKIDFLLKETAYFGFENLLNVNTGLGFGAERGKKILADLMKDYQEITFFLEDGRFDQTPCPQRNTQIFLKYGLEQNGMRQYLSDGTLVLPTSSLCPIDFFTGEMNKSKETISIHHFSASWHKNGGTEIRKIRKKQKGAMRTRRFVKKIIGERGYLWLKKMFRRS